MFLSKPIELYTGSVEQGADSKIVKERINPAVQVYCCLLFFYVNSIVHVSPLLLILFNKSPNLLYQEQQGFSRLM